MPVSSVEFDAIKKRTDIVTVIHKRASLTKAGKEYKAICPFHEEKTPSFYVNRDYRVYHCFSCGEHGDVVDFVERFDKVDRLTALAIAADESGVRSDSAA